MGCCCPVIQRVPLLRNKRGRGQTVSSQVRVALRTLCSLNTRNQMKKCQRWDNSPFGSYAYEIWSRGFLCFDYEQYLCVIRWNMIAVGSPCVTVLCKSTTHLSVPRSSPAADFCQLCWSTSTAAAAATLHDRSPDSRVMAAWWLNLQIISKWWPDM